MLQTRIGGNAYRRQAVELLLERPGSDGRVIVPREKELGWNVKQRLHGEVLRKFAGPPRAKGPGKVEQMAEAIVHNRLAKEAIDWLQGYENGGAARKRAERKAGTR